MQLVIDGLLTGGLYAATALGLSLVFGTLRMVNLAHGELLMVGAYLTSVLVVALGADPLILAIPAAIVLGALAYPLQRYVLTPIMARNADAPVTATFGVSVAVQSVLLLLFTSNPRSLPAPYATASFEVLGVTVRVALLIATAIGVVLVIGLHLLLTRTPFGNRVRAAAGDAVAAGLVGIDVNRTFAMVFAIAAAAAAIGGSLIAVTYSVSPSGGTSWLVIAFTVVVIGGLGSIRGTLAGALILGVVQTVGVAVVGAQYRDIIVFGLLVVILLIRPRGLFTKAQRV
ncbi:branched-chain amino acid ABC transporter permease [Herbiconiux sp. CPCC 203407]|uniref:Branched-chain amino acid ABC transporter permease n=1 Tax=Herbiconiux oxytropis TaxID=2970915 RepID=A0AA42BU35_9MICO|nr:branched-chain amino acid ABC transporter permease [Herbiconiux oxytropis]MCS5722929.1 branched-chain amino acid ABC transporter permease [Herbiconiux oxytropis]MCS5725811.1 branched-chain amino acid ABC transporter permease [Herbiconiux oxytropis]